MQFDAKSETQSLWEDALDDFYSARYRSAVDKIMEVKELYPAHTLADSYLRIAQARIANGEDSGSPILLYVLVTIAGASMAGMAIMIVVIVRHNRHHQQYKIAHPPAGH